MTTFEEINETFLSAKQGVITLQLEIEELESKSSELRRARTNAAEELERLLELEQQDAVTRALDGEEAAPKKPKRLTRIGNLNEQVASIDLALPIHQRKLDEAYSRLEDANAKVCEAILPEILEQKSAALQACAEPLKRLVDVLVELAAIDALQQRFSASDGSIRISGEIDARNLFSARAIIERFRKSLPPRFADLASESLASADQRITDRAAHYAAEIGA